MSCDPYLDTDWAIAILDPEISHVLWLTDEEMKIAKKKTSDRDNKALKLTQNQGTRKTA